MEERGCRKIRVAVGNAQSPPARCWDIIAERAPLRAWNAFVDDLNNDDWQFYAAEPAWLSPCFFTCMATALSVRAAAVQGLFWTYGWGPLLVLVSSLIHWWDPRRDSWRRTLDVVTVRTGMTAQWLQAPQPAPF